VKPSHNPLKLKERMQVPRQEMPQRDAAERARTFEEVNLGFGAEIAKQESLRCLECADPKCSKGCPVGVDVRAFVDLVLVGDYLGAAAKMREANVLPAITGRVCPQEEACEGACLLSKKVPPLAIGHLERFIADYERRMNAVGLPPNAPSTGRKVAIVGSGPAGLAAAGDLVQKGHAVTVFEALHEIGGVLIYGIPPFRLPRDIVRHEVDNLRRMGVEFQTNVVVGRTVTVDELFAEGYGAVFVATGAGLPKFLGIPGEHLNGVYSANEWLTRVNLMHAGQFPEYDEPVFDCRGKDVAVVGGGNTALDGIRVALRLGARKAYLIYRRSEKEMPARLEEVRHAREEGVEFHVLTNPVEFLGDEQGYLSAARCIRMELGEPDESGRRSPIPVPGSEFTVPLSAVIIAAGTTANPLVQSATPDLATRKGGYIVADGETLRTSKRGVFAGGDIVTGGATVILAMGAGRTAARAIDEYLTTGCWVGEGPKAA
jgi:glutamate synthase (NADPH/NADH) small chain